MTHSGRLTFGLIFTILVVFPENTGWSRGFGGGGGGGGGRGGFSGGGGGERGGGGFGGGERSGGGAEHRGGGGEYGGGGFNSAGRNNVGGNERGGSGGFGENGRGNPGEGGHNTAGNRNTPMNGYSGGQRNRPQSNGEFGRGGPGGSSSPNRNQLNSFLGMPSDEGMPHGGAAAAGATGVNRNQSQHTGAQGAAAGAYAENRNQPEHSGAQGAVAGAAVSNRNQPQFSGAQGAAAGAYAANRNQPQFSGAQGAAAGYAAGANGYGGGFGKYYSPSQRYNAATAIRSGYNNYGAYGTGWYARNPGAWAAAGWTANNFWNTANWNSAGAWCGMNSSYPIYYDYGNSITYDNDNVYNNSINMGSSEQYYQGAVDLASQGAAAAAPPDSEWLSLGVFALSKIGESTPVMSVQLAVNKQGIIRGNATDSATDTTQVIQGSVDKDTQRAAFTIGKNTTNVIETGLYNLTKDEAPGLMHYGQEKTDQLLLTRIKQSENAQPTP